MDSIQIRFFFENLDINQILNIQDCHRVAFDLSHFNAGSVPYIGSVDELTPQEEQEILDNGGHICDLDRLVELFIESGAVNDHFSRCFDV